MIEKAPFRKERGFFMSVARWSYSFNYDYADSWTFCSSATFSRMYFPTN